MWPLIQRTPLIIFWIEVGTHIWPLALNVGFSNNFEIDIFTSEFYLSTKNSIMQSMKDLKNDIFGIINKASIGLCDKPSIGYIKRTVLHTNESRLKYGL